MAILTEASALGNAVRSERKQLGMTQEALALTAGVGLRFIVELERGKPSVRLSHVFKVLAVLGLELGLQARDHPREAGAMPYDP